MHWPCQLGKENFKSHLGTIRNLKEATESGQDALTTWQAMREARCVMDTCIVASYHWANGRLFGRCSFFQRFQFSPLTLASKKFLAPLTPSVETSISDRRAKAWRPLSSSNSPAAALRKIRRNWNVEKDTQMYNELQLSRIPGQWLIRKTWC